MRWRPGVVVSPIEPDELRGCLLGGAIGDAVGFGYENRPAREVLELEVGETSDDTQLTLATVEAIASDSGRVDPESIARGFVEWHRREGIRGIGAATAKAIRELSVGGHWALVGRKGEMAAGNGAAIRIAPLAFVLDPRSSMGRTKIRDVARITHHSDEAYVGALAVCLAIHDAAAGRLDLEAIARELPDTSVRDRIIEIAQQDFEEAVERGNGGYVVESVPLALLAASRAGPEGFADMVRGIVSHGGDCDSIASMAGQVWGAAYGVDALPAELLERLPERERIEKLAEKLLGTVSRR